MISPMAESLANMDKLLLTPRSDVTYEHSKNALEQLKPLHDALDDYTSEIWAVYKSYTKKPKDVEPPAPTSASGSMKVMKATKKILKKTMKK